MVLVAGLDWSQVAEAIRLLPEEIYYVELVLLFDGFFYRSV